LLVNRYDRDAIGFKALLSEFGDGRFGVSHHTAHGDDRVFRRHMSSA
jgi:hypothetical protein